MADLLHVGDVSFDPEDLTFKEKREIRRIIRVDLWDSDVMGDFDFTEVAEEEIIAATVFVFMRRDNPEYTLDEAMDLKPSEVMREDVDLPPTLPASAAKRSSPRASARKKTSAASGSVRAA